MSSIIVADTVTTGWSTLSVIAVLLLLVTLVGKDALMLASKPWAKTFSGALNLVMTPLVMAFLTLVMTQLVYLVG